RAGRRIGASSFWRVGLLTAGVTFAALSLGVVVSATHPVAVPSLVQGVLFPTVIFMVGLVVGLQRAMVRRTADQGGVPLTALSDLVRRIPHHVRVVVGAAVRGGLAAVAGVMVVSAVACAALIGVRYAEIVALYESVHTGVLGGIALTLGQLVLTPNLVLWAAAWFVGPGFAIGAGSSVAPLGTSLGTVPAIPVLGAVLVEASAWGFVGLVVPVVAAFAAGAVARRMLAARLGDGVSLLLRVLTGVGIGVVGGAVLGVLAAFSGGSAGPGRLAVVGPDPLLVGLWAALEFGVAATAGMLAGARSRSD
ncbi:MAG TPA: DUF6350 family protein, partial [Terrimesophilobacter sp.]|nr:DUF6350 family protein [Terrimesophilobacter sp.]